MKLLLSMLLVLSSPVYAFECIVELASKSAKAVDYEGVTYVLNNMQDRLVVDKCDRLKNLMGSIRVFYADDSGYPNEELVNEGGHLSAIGTEQYAPFIFLVTQVRNMVEGDRGSFAGSKRAFSKSGIQGFPSQKILYPKKGWRFSSKGFQPVSFKLMSKAGLLIAEFRPNDQGLFEVGAKYIEAGRSYQWQAGGKKGHFNVLTKNKTKEIENEISEALSAKSSKELNRMIYAAICNDYNLFFDSLMAISDAK